MEVFRSGRFNQLPQISVLSLRKIKLLACLFNTGKRFYKSYKRVHAQETTFLKSFLFKQYFFSTFALRADAQPLFVSSRNA